MARIKRDNMHFFCLSCIFFVYRCILEVAVVSITFEDDYELKQFQKSTPNRVRIAISS